MEQAALRLSVTSVSTTRPRRVGWPPVESNIRRNLAARSDRAQAARRAFFRRCGDE
jgi:hypothetical protein